MDTLSFIGRPDGLGNRLEEIILLEAVCARDAIACEYVWSSKHAHRAYAVLCSAQRVSIRETGPSYPLRTWAELPTGFAREEMLAAARLIRPAFELSFPRGERPIGIHIRATDRIGKIHPHFMRDEEELKLYLSSTIALINALSPRAVFVCSESPECRAALVKRLHPGIEVVAPQVSPDVPGEYADFFALSLCDEIFMSSKFSSYALVAAMIGNARLHTFVDDAGVRDRYKLDYVLHACGSENVVSERLVQRDVLARCRELFRAALPRKGARRT